MRGLLDRITGGEVLAGDGAMGTLLMEHGLEPGQCPESFNLERPEVLREVARRYLEAGADIVQTNTFGATPVKLARYGLEDRADEINAQAVQAVRDAVGPRAAYVSGSCGPCGSLLAPYGEADPDVVREAFSRQVRALVGAGVDMLCIETMTDLAEARLAVEAARSVSSSVPLAVTMTFDPTPNGFFTIMGTSIEQAVSGLTDSGADIIGSNCGNGIEKMVEIAGDLRRRSALPLLIQSNAGLPELVGGRVVYPETPERLAEGCERLLDLGVNIIGGCCGTTPAHIAAMRRVVDEGL